MSFVIGGLGSKFTKGNLIVLTERPEYGKIAQSVWLGVNTSIWIMAVIVILLGILLTRTVIGRYMIAAGGNAQAARLARLQPRFTVVGVLFIALIGNGFDLLGIDPLYHQITLGLILLIAVGVDAYGRSHRD